jgi:hypothetical protein
MSWIIWAENADRDNRPEYVRRITPTFVSYTVDRADAARFASRADARAALKGTGLTAYRVKDLAETDEAPPEPPADDGPPFT